MRPKSEPTSISAARSFECAITINGRNGKIKFRLVLGYSIFRLIYDVGLFHTQCFIRWRNSYNVSSLTHRFLSLNNSFKHLPSSYVNPSSHLEPHRNRTIPAHRVHMAQEYTSPSIFLFWRPSAHMVLRSDLFELFRKIRRPRISSG